MISYITEVTLCLLGFYLLYVLLLSKETFFNANRWYLMGTLLTSLTIPFIEMPNFAAQINNGITAFYIEPITITVQSLESTLEEIVITPQEEGFDFRSLFVLIYFLVVLVLLSRFLFGLFQIYSLKRQGTIESKGDYFLVKTNKSHLPFSFFNYLFWSEKANFTKDEEEKILRHELAHIRDKHSYDVILLELLSIFLWCSPLIFLYKKAIKNIHEYLADAAVLQNTQTRQYGQLLLKQSQSGIRIAQANNFIHSQLKKRIIMMTKNKSRQRSMLKYVAMLPIALILVLVLSQKDVLANLKADDTFIENQTDINATDKSEKILGDVNEMPRFPGCEDFAKKEERNTCSSKKLIEFMYKNIKYPEAAKKDGLEGTVVIDFVVQEDGSLAKFKILKDIGGGCGEESVRVMKMMPKWIPGKKDGKAVSVNFKIPVKFRLDGEDKVINLPKKDGSYGDEVFVVVEEMPVFPGCADIEDGFEKKDCSKKQLFQFVYSNIKYPKEANKKGVEGKVVVKFIVDKDGNVTDPKIVKDPGEGLGTEVLRVINLMNEMPEKWTPGQQKGKNVSVALTLPVIFKAEKNDPNATPNLNTTQSNSLELAHFNAFPNPTNGNLNIELGEVDFPTTIKITDINGREIYSKKIEKVDAGTIKINDIDVSNAAKGNLIIVVEQDGKTTSKKIVVQ